MTSERAVELAAVTAEERFWSYVERNGPTECWPWTGERGRGRGQGYGRFYFSQAKPRVRAHRFAYELLVGPIAPGLVIDHLCRNPACVNPAHLEPVTNRENIRRGNSMILPTECQRGHPFTGNNVMYRAEGWRSCRQCKNVADRLRMRRYRAAGKAV